jgi:hypothetical protein
MDDSGSGADQPVEAPATITCVDCGGTCHLLTPPMQDEDGRIDYRAGDLVAYRCSECLDRWDIELE